jgi:hypothetical protein
MYTARSVESLFHEIHLSSLSLLGLHSLALKWFGMDIWLSSPTNSEK